MDNRWKQLGDILVNYSTAVQPGDRVMIAMVEPETFLLAKAVYEAVIKAGGYPQIQLLSEVLRKSLLEHGNNDQISWIPEMESWGMEWADVYFGLRGAHNLYELSDISPEKLAANQSAMGAVSSQRWKKTRWCLVRVPNESFAQQAHTNYEIIEEMFFSSCFIDWKQKSFTWNKWALQLGKGKYIQIVGKGTDLSFSTEGRKWIPFAGKNNMPDGEIATAPIISTVNGTITFEHPGILGGRFVHDIRLTWEKGVLTDAHSSSEQAFFQSILSKDKGAACIGEFALGTNFNITRFCNDILIDEKIGGTIHIALGRAYPECGGKNVSSIHWDIIKDIRKDGCVLLDGMPIVKKGNILL